MTLFHVPDEELEDIEWYYTGLPFDEDDDPYIDDSYYQDGGRLEQEWDYKFGDKL